MLSSEIRANLRAVRAPRLVSWARILLLVPFASLASAGPIVNVQFTCSPLCLIGTDNSYGFFDSGLQAGAFVHPVLLAPSGSCCNTDAFDTITLLADLTTDGPVRPGIIEYSISIFGPGSATVDGVGGRCQGCTVPITLGVPFEVVLTATSSEACEAGVGCFGVEGGTDLSFQIIDPQTTAPVELHDVTVPEPRGLVGVGLLLLIARKLRNCETGAGGIAFLPPPTTVRDGSTHA